jgi:hypothetical protein
METQYSIVQNSIGGGFNALVMRAWYTDEDGNQITIKSEVKTGLTLDECFNLAKAFVEETQKTELTNG